MTLDPYSGTAKLVLYAVVAVAVLGAFARWRYVEGALDDARSEVARLEADAAVRAKNEVLAAAIAGKWRAADEKRTASASAAKRRVYDAKKPVPVECLPVLVPLGRALNGVRELRSERGNGGAPSPGSSLLTRPRAARFG